MTVQPVEAILLLAMTGLAADLFVTCTWSERWFRFGPVILRKVVQATVVTTRMSVLERVNQRTAWPALVFKKLSNRTVVFREALPPRLFAVPYLPLMRGEIVVDHETSRAYVIGRLNPFFMTTTLCLMGLAVGASGDVANFILFVPLVALNVWLQWIRFGDVAKAITPSHEGIATN